MSNSAIDLFAANEELAHFARQAKDSLAFWVTVIVFGRLIKSGTEWSVADSYLNSIGPLESVDVLLTPGKPSLEGVTQVYDFLQQNSFSSWMCFVFRTANSQQVLASRVLSYASSDSPYGKKIQKLMRHIRAHTRDGIWIFSKDNKEREFFTRIHRFTAGAKELQDHGAQVSIDESGPTVVLGEECPYPLSEAKVFVREKKRT